MTGEARLEVILDHVALRAGATLSGTVLLRLAKPTAVDWIGVEIAGRELAGATGRYAPAVYQVPLPRPWGRTRSGTAYAHLRREVPILGRRPHRTASGRRAFEAAGAAPLPAGSHVWSFAVPVPADAFPSYGGAGVVVEHDVVATVMLAGGRKVRAWAPFHLWAGRGAPVTAPAVAVTARSAGGAALTVEVPAGGIAIGFPVTLEYRLENRAREPVRQLVVTLEGVETVRLHLATDVNRYRVARHTLPAPRGAAAAGELVWVLPPRLAPDLDGKRFRLRWELQVGLTIPWRIGGHGTVRIPVWDPLTVGPDPSSVEEDPGARREARATGHKE